MARNAVLKPKELAEQILPINRKVREVGATLRPAHRRRQRDRQNLKQVMPRRVAGAWIRQRVKRLLKPVHREPPRRTLP